MKHMIAIKKKVDDSVKKLYTAKYIC